MRFVVIEAGTWRDDGGRDNGTYRSKCSVVDKRKWRWRLMVS